jgi:hypothetical protein
MDEKEWWEESPEEFASGFTEEVHVHHAESEQKSMVGNKEAQYEPIYGPCPQFSEYKRGERIRYRTGQGIVSGVIAWVCAPQVVAGKHAPTQYVVEPDGRGGFPDIISAGDVIL